MSTTIVTSPEVDGGSLAGRTRHTIRRVARRLLLGIKLQHLLFLAFTVIAAVPIVALSLWQESVTYRNELDSVRERHLLVARNLTSALSRYVDDVKSAFALAFESGGLRERIPGLEQFLTSLNVEQVRVIGPDGKIERTLGGILPTEPLAMDPGLLQRLRKLAADAPSLPALTPLERNSKGEPVFYLVRPLPDGRLGVGVLTHDYILTLQKQIAFGDRGHAAIVDSTGRIIAHPFSAWIAKSQDLSAVSVVQAMMRGETGVGQFYSPAMNGMMVAGYSAVPGTGWGVMVPQPLAELQRRAAEVNWLATIVAVVAFGAAALLSWLLAAYLARPVRQVAGTAEAVLGGNEQVSVTEFRGLVPRELRRLRIAFNTMLDDLRRRNADTTVALRQAESSSVAKSQFLANMSHEIRTPIHGVVGMIELLQQTELSPMQLNYLRAARQSSDALQTVIEDVLDLSKIEAGKMELEHAPFHLPTLVHDVLAMFADLARSKGLTLTTSVPDELNLMVLGDAHRIGRIVTNLVANALKFTAVGGVTIRLSRLENSARGISLRCEVTDTGIGIPVAKQQAIFEAFSQADTSTTRRYGGTGLGLSIARQLCRLMSGDIGVTSTVGLGSTFWFTARLDFAPGAAIPAPRVAEPVRYVAPTAVPKPAAPPAPKRTLDKALSHLGRSSIHVLLVEDNPSSMRVTQALLEALGCDVTGARNGLEAVATYRDGHFDIVLMDCQMPELDGYEATRAIRLIEAARDQATPIVALTANALSGSREASLESGMNDHLTKPLSLADLIAKLSQWLAHTGNQDRHAAE